MKKFYYWLKDSIFMAKKYLWAGVEAVINNMFKIWAYCLFTALVMAIIHQGNALSRADRANDYKINKVEKKCEGIRKEIYEARDDTLLMVEQADEAINARIDIVDDTINIEDKRRALVEKIRVAIIEEKHGPIGVRDLNRIANAVIDYSYQYNLTIPQVLAQIQTESNFDPYAVSRAGAKGLLQIMPHTLKYIQYEIDDGPRNLNAFNIYHNVKAGCFYMAQQIEDFGSYELALWAYNWGPDNLRKYMAGERKDMPLETQNYAPIILERIKIFEGYGLE